ncbi:MAG: tetratricopeptide repeat protein, partial [Armatimonadia bacterium]|nr:tetratricopeptide repeat protein [Armatimonadia bacterium]
MTDRMKRGKARRRLRGAAMTIAALLLCVAVWAEEAFEQQVTDLRADGDLPQAAAAACEWASADPGNIDALQACAELAAQVGRYSEAEDALRSLLFYMPSDPASLVALGQVLLDRGRFAEAREQFEEAIRLTGASAPAYAGLARVSVYDSQSP